MGFGKDEMTGHGFRSMASTLLHEQGWNHQAIERQLAQVGDRAVAHHHISLRHAVNAEIDGDTTRAIGAGARETTI